MCFDTTYEQRSVLQKVSDHATYRSDDFGVLLGWFGVILGVMAASDR